MYRKVGKIRVSYYLQSDTEPPMFRISSCPMSSISCTGIEKFRNLSINYQSH